MRLALAAIMLATPTGCSSGEATLPESLEGTWQKSGGEVERLSFTSGGRVEITLRSGGPVCSGEYELAGHGKTDANLRTGYIKCSPVMDGYVTGDPIEIEDGTLTIRGVLGGTYERH